MRELIFGIIRVYSSRNSLNLAWISFFPPSESNLGWADATLTSSYALPYLFFFFFHTRHVYSWPSFWADLSDWGDSAMQMPDQGCSLPLKWLWLRKHSHSITRHSLVCVSARRKFTGTAQHNHHRALALWINGTCCKHYTPQHASQAAPSHLPITQCWAHARRIKTWAEVVSVAHGKVTDSSGEKKIREREKKSHLICCYRCIILVQTQSWNDLQAQTGDDRMPVFSDPAVKHRWKLTTDVKCRPVLPFDNVAQQCSQFTSAMKPMEPAVQREVGSFSAEKMFPQRADQPLTSGRNRRRSLDSPLQPSDILADGDAHILSPGFHRSNLM